MSVTGEMNRYRRSELTLGALTVAAILSMVLGHRFLVLVLEDVGFIVLLALTVLFVVMAWWRFAREWSSYGARWRAWISLAGCAALSLAFAVPLVLFLFSFVLPWGFGPRWDFKMLILTFSLASLLAGTLTARLVRFPLVLGGLVMAIL
jgi:hypothetical protein